MALTDTHIRNAKPGAKAYKLSDTGGLYLLVMPTGARYWRLDYRFAGKRRTLAIGVYPLVSLANARARREDARACLARNIDPSSEKRRTQRAAKLANENTFEGIAREWIDNQRDRLSPRYRALLLARLVADIFPQIGAGPIATIDSTDLLGALRKVEARGATETAGRLRQTCGQIFRYAVASGRAKRDPTVDLRGALRPRGRKRGHKAMPLAELPAFLAKLEAYDGEPRTRIALRLMILDLHAHYGTSRSAMAGVRKSWWQRAYLARSGGTYENEEGAHCAARSTGDSATERAARSAPWVFKPIPLSFALARKMHEQQHDAVCSISNGLSWSRDRPWLPRNGFHGSQ